MLVPHVTTVPIAGTVPAVNVRPVLVFVLTLMLIAPVIAIAGVVAWGTWTPIGLGAAGWLVAWTGYRALPSVQRSPAIAGVRLRMLTVVWMVIVAAGLLTAGSALWLGWHLVG